MLSKILPLSEDAFLASVAHLKMCKLVAFPTETVYGLGANALDAAAVEKIFVAKGRPKSDPLIVHVLTKSEAKNLVVFTPDLEEIFDALSEKFWPGPLTIVCPANHLVPAAVTANTGYVGLRSPKHPVAQRLLNEVQLPIAAPSANRFGHVSPTSAHHVLADLPSSDILILDGGECSVGVESTVVKISSSQLVQILRPGFVTKSMIEEALKLHSLELTVEETFLLGDSAVKHQSPGHLLTHYAPSKNCFLWDVDVEFSQIQKNIDSQNTVLIDFNKHLSKYADNFLNYIDLSPSGSFEEASQNLFRTLRDVENIENCQLILLPKIKILDERWNAIFDRMFRAASGKILA